MRFTGYHDYRILWLLPFTSWPKNILLRFINKSEKCVHVNRMNVLSAISSDLLECHSNWPRFNSADIQLKATEGHRHATDITSAAHCTVNCFHLKMLRISFYLMHEYFMYKLYTYLPIKYWIVFSQQAAFVSSFAHLLARRAVNCDEH